MKRLLMYALFFIIISSLVYADDVPEIGHQFYGYAGSGSTISAVVNGVTFTAAVASDKYYGYSSVFFVDAASDGISGGENGDTITFYIDGIQNTTYTFAVGGVTKLDFAIDPGLTTGGATDDGATSSNDTSSTTTSSTSSSSDDSDSHRSSSGSSSSGKTTTTTSSDSGCYHKWQCTSWNACEENGFQTRICYYVGNCTTEGNQSDTRQRCTYVAPEEEYVPVEEPVYPTCYDGIKNQGERGIDCGGPCEACEIPIPEEPKSNGLYIALGIFIILLIIAIILGYKYKDKWMPYWERLKSKFVKTPSKPLPTQQYKPQYPQQYRPQNQQYRQQYPQYRK